MLNFINTAKWLSKMITHLYISTRKLWKFQLHNLFSNTGIIFINFSNRMVCIVIFIVGLSYD